MSLARGELPITSQQRLEALGTNALRWPENHFEPPMPKGKACYYIGLAYIELERYDEAKESLVAAITLAPRLSDAYCQLGRVCYLTQDYRGAIAAYTRALEELQIAPVGHGLANTYNNRGLVYYAIAKFSLAIADYRQALRLNPCFALAHNNCALAYYALGDYPRAIAECNCAIKCDPQLAPAYNHRGLAYLASRKYEEAIADFARALDSAPDLEAAWINLNSAYREREEYRLALEEYHYRWQKERCQNMAATAYFQRGIAARERGDFEAAIADLHTALQLEPQPRPAIYHHLKQCYSQLARSQFSCGIIQHPLTKKWQVWFGYRRQYITCIFACQIRKLAEQIQQRLAAELESNGSDRRALAIVNLIREVEGLAESETVNPLPRSCQEEITRCLREQKDPQPPQKSQPSQSLSWWQHFANWMQAQTSTKKWQQI